MAVDPQSVVVENNTVELDAQPMGVPIRMLAFNIFFVFITTDGIVNGYVMYNENRRPVRVVKVHLLDRDMIIETTTTDAFGQYIFSGVRTESCRVQIILPTKGE